MLAIAAACSVEAATIAAERLRCENQQNPLAVQASRPRLSWLVQAVDTNRRGLRQTGYEILVASSLKLLERRRGDLWSSGKTSPASTSEVEYGGKDLVAQTSYYWKVRLWDQDGQASSWSKPAQWTMALLGPKDWRAKWIAAEPDQPQTGAGRGQPKSGTMPLFRHTFRLNKRVARSLLHISGLGQYEARVNGTKVADAVLTPGWTDYRKTVYYNTYDVSGLLRTGGNAIGVMLGNGMYNVVKVPGRYTKFAGSFGQPKLIAQLRIVFADGQSIDIISNASWKTHSGPITFSHPYGGEDYDARLEPDGWDMPASPDQDWSQAQEVGGPGGNLVAQLNPDIKVLRLYDPVRLSTPKPGILVYDLGQNFSGWPRITVRGAAGATIKLIPGELLDDAGLVSQQSSKGPQWYSYTLKGSGNETWRPRFSYWGFRYVQVEGASQDSITLQGQFVHSSATATGQFSCSKPLFNRIHDLIGAAIRSNMQSVFTDCPHREKLGWLEETHLLGSAILYNYDVSRLYEKVADDIHDSQQANGLVPDIAPEYVVFDGGFRDSPEWGSAAVLDPWLAYRHFAGRQNLTRHYEDMKRYVEYLSSRAQDGIISYGLGDWYDIGPGAPGYSKLTSTALTATAIYYADIITMKKVAELLGKAEDARSFESLASAVRGAFNAKLLDPSTGVYDRGSQTAFAMPLAVGLVPAEHRAAVLNKLVDDIRRHDNHVTAGDVGFHFVVQALSEGGRSDVIYDMLSRTDAPSYGFQLAQGATSLTEAWDASPRSSQNHFMLGHAEEWFYRHLAGIDFDVSRPEPERITIRPRLAGDISEAQASYDSVLGRIVSHWKREPGKVQLEVVVPPNSTATVHVPTKGASSVNEGGQPAAQSQSVHFLREEQGAAVYGVGSGRYRFEAVQ